MSYDNDIDYKLIKKYIINITNNRLLIKKLFDRLFYEFLPALMDAWGGSFRIVHPDSVQVAVYSTFIYTFKDYSRNNYQKANCLLYKFLTDESYQVLVLKAITDISSEQREYAEEKCHETNTTRPHINYNFCEMKFYDIISREADNAFYDIFQENN